jgi:hypothetical protein
VIGRILLGFPDETRQILEWSIQHGNALTSVFPGPEQEDRARKIVYMLGAVGTRRPLNCCARSLTTDSLAGPP